MGDHLEALERLARLRGDGTLTEEEFQSEKAKLLAASATGFDTLAHGREGPEEVSRSLWSSLKWPIVALVILMPIFGYFAWPHLGSMTSEEATQVIADSVDGHPHEGGPASGKAEGSTSDALALNGAWLVGVWTLDGTCSGGGFGMRFHSDGTYENFDSDEGRYSTDGKSIRFYQRRTVPELGDDEGFKPKALGDEIDPAQPMTKNSMLLDGHEMIRC